MNIIYIYTHTHTQRSYFVLQYKRVRLNNLKCKSGTFIALICALKDGNGQWGGMGLKNGVFAPTLYGFVLSHPYPTPSYKTLFLVNLPTTITIVFNKTYFITKNIFEITNKFIPSNQSNYQKKLNKILLKCLRR